MLPALLFNIPIPSVLALIASTFVIEYGAAAAGIGMGLPPLYVLYAVTCIALGVTLTLFDIFDLLGRHSERVSGFLAKSSERAGRSVFLKKYGIYGLVPCVITLGFYVCPPVSWVMGWPQEQVNFVDYGRIYRHLDSNDSCDNRIFQNYWYPGMRGGMQHHPEIPKKRPLPELLAPAGSPEAFHAAVAAGADAVYLSGKRFGARKFATKFY